MNQPLDEPPEGKLNMLRSDVAYNGGLACSLHSSSPRHSHHKELIALVPLCITSLSTNRCYCTKKLRSQLSVDKRCVNGINFQLCIPNMLLRRSDGVFGLSDLMKECRAGEGGRLTQRRGERDAMKRRRKKDAMIRKILSGKRISLVGRV